MRTLSLLSVLALSLVPVLSAQGQTRLPRTPPSERTLNRINRSLQQEQNQQEIQRQNQFETNQIRQSIDRQQAMPIPRIPPSPGSLGRIGGCPAGSVGC